MHYTGAFFVFNDGRGGELLRVSKYNKKEEKETSGIPCTPALFPSLPSRVLSLMTWCLPIPCHVLMDGGHGGVGEGMCCGSE